MKNPTHRKADVFPVEVVDSCPELYGLRKSRQRQGRKDHESGSESGKRQESVSRPSERHDACEIKKPEATIMAPAHSKAFKS